MVLLTFFERTFATIFGGTVHPIFGTESRPKLLALGSSATSPSASNSTVLDCDFLSHDASVTSTLDQINSKLQWWDDIFIEFCIKTYSLPETNPMTDPWDWYIYRHEGFIFMVNVGKHTSPLDPMGMRLSHGSFIRKQRGEQTCLNPPKSFSRR